LEEIKYLIAGDSALVISFGEEIAEEINEKVLLLCERIEKENIEGIIELVPSYRDVCVFYDPLETTFKQITENINQLLKEELLPSKKERIKNIIEIPVIYGGNYGPDLDYVAKKANLTPKEVIKLHSSREYRVYMIGFSPGFPYLGGLDERIHTPRRTVPIPMVPKNSVGIGGKQTAIITIDTPSGWWFIGKTPLDFFQINRFSISTLAKAGYYIKFKQIDEEGYNTILNS